MPRTPEPPEIPPAMCSFTCDWGDCEEETTAWRWSGQRLNESPLGWLPVCAIHASAADAVVAHNDGLACGPAGSTAPADPHPTHHSPPHA